MRITHLGHACVLVEARGTRLLIDPGSFSDAWRPVVGLDGILVTHRHRDHVDPAHAPALVAANVDASLYMEQGAAAEVTLAGAEVVGPETHVQIGGLTVHAVGGQHAVIHRDIPRVGNVGYVVSAPEEPTFFHPGDCLDVAPDGVDVVAVPMHGPWAAMGEHVDFLRELGAGHAFGIHDGLLSERGWRLAFDRYDDMTSTIMHDLRGGEPWDVPAPVQAT